MRLIDADKLCEDFVERWEIADKEKESAIIGVFANIVTPIVVGQPTVDPVKHGRWMKVSDNEYDSAWECSVCKQEWMFEAHPKEDCGCNYCPNCGAMMDEVGE